MSAKRFNCNINAPMARCQFHRKNVLLMLLMAVIVTKSNALSDNINMPCKYLDSINITNGEVHSDGTITFEGISYPKSLYATYDYEFVNESYRHPVASHVRGCSCAIDPSKPCVRMCCPRGHFLLPTKQCVPNDAVYNMSVLVSDGSSQSEENIFDAFNYVVGLPCFKLNKLDPVKEKQTDSWDLLKDGSILKGDIGNVHLNKNQYCFNSIPRNDSIETAVMVCFKPFEDTRDYWLLCGMFLSVPFLLATIAVYLYLPKLRNIHGISLVCYLSGLVVGYTTIALIKLNGSAAVDPNLCRAMAYITYFAFMSAFFWLNVISFDLWRSCCNTTSGIHGRRKYFDMKKFIYYSIYAWGSTIAMVVLCVVIDSVPSTSIPSSYKPLMGVETCYLGKSWWTQFFYLYLPIMLIMGCNLIFFVLISWKITAVQLEMTRITDRNESSVHRKNLDKEKARCGLYLRLFIVMGVAWTMEVVSFIVSPEGIYFYLTDAVNVLQGVIIFFLFVMKEKVKQQIARRWRISRGVLQTKNNDIAMRKGEAVAEMELTTNSSI